MPSPNHMQDHIDTIVKHEQEFLTRRTLTERFGDSVAGFAGSLPFVAGHILVFFLWVIVNAKQIGNVPHFDPPPFSLLGTCVGLEAILLVSFILMRQARLARRSDERGHLMLQILLLAEKELTAIVQMNRQIAVKVGLHGVGQDKEIQQLGENISIDDVAQTIQDNLAAEA
jgi:uncharacterized membrane protein